MHVEWLLVGANIHRAFILKVEDIIDVNVNVWRHPSLVLFPVDLVLHLLVKAHCFIENGFWLAARELNLPRVIVSATFRWELSVKVDCKRFAIGCSCGFACVEEDE